MTALWASHHEELCSAGVVAPHVHTPMVASHRWGGLDGGTPLGSAVDASRRPSMGRPLPHSFLRNALLDVTTILPATAYHQRNDVETYRRSISASTNAPARRPWRVAATRSASRRATGVPPARGAWTTWMPDAGQP
jgi:hypothetical protein